MPFFLIIAFLIAFKAPVWGAQAYPFPVEITQADGSKLTIIQKGDERIKWAQTTDGYSIVRNKKGIYEYAMLDGDNDFVTSGIKAKNKSERAPTENQFLNKTQKGIHYSKHQVALVKSIASQQRVMAQNAFPTTGSRNLVCILIGFTDKGFVKAKSDFENLFNQIGYTTDDATGSVYDFYKENSWGQLDLTVTVAGPYTASHAMAYYGANTGYENDSDPKALITEAVNLANPTVNFANFDNDNDGYVDGVYVIYAGYGEEYAGVSSDAIWAHAGDVNPITVDGKTMSKYSCSGELRGNDGTGITRIGVICHEFGHVLGAADYYDTDYSANGYFEGTGQWDLMSIGLWNNEGATPAHHNAYTKIYDYNWATATTLNAKTMITLKNAEDNSDSFYRIDTNTANEYYLIENRQKHKFDSNIPGHGMIIYHVDGDYISSAGNEINTGSHQGMYPVCANALANPPIQYGSINSDGLPFPGTGGKLFFSDATIPGSKSWAGMATNKPISGITEDVLSKTITFDFLNLLIPPLAPIAKAATLVNQTDFTANWNASETATGYSIDVSTSNDFSTFISGYNNKDLGNATSSIVTGLSYNTLCYYRIRAYNSYGVSFHSNLINLYTLPEIVFPPQAPQAQNPVSITQNGFSALWYAAETATKYFLDVSTDNSFDTLVSGYNNLDVGNVNTIPIIGLLTNTSYYYRVRAYNSGGVSGNSNTIHLITLPYAPAAPVATVATDIIQSFFWANWNVSATATRYYVDVAKNSTFTQFVSGYKNLNVGNVTTSPIFGLLANTVYYYRIRAYNAGGLSDNSNTIELITLPDVPDTPTASIASNIQASGFTANWNSSLNATGYYLDLSPDDSFSQLLVGFNSKDVGNVTSVAVTGLMANTSYYYRVRAYNTGGESENSNIIHQTTLPNKPDIPLVLAATSINQSGFLANWNLSESALGYYLDISENNSFSSFVEGYNNRNMGNVTSATIIGLTANTSYYYRVRAYNAGGESENSMIIHLITLPYAPEIPVAIEGTAVRPSEFTARWNSSATATGYYLDLSKNDSFSQFIDGYHDLDVGSLNFLSITGLLPNTTYYYRLKAYNTGGESGYSNTIVTTTTQFPTASFSAPITNGCNPLTVFFNDESTGVPTSWAWDIDNNGTVDYTIENPVHQYNIPGIYTVTLTVNNAAGSDTKTKTSFITVYPLSSAATAIDGKATVCQTEHEILYWVSPIENASSYKWTLPQGASGTSETNSILVNFGTSAISGNITVKGINTCGEGLSSSFAIVVNPLPSPASAITGKSSVCQAQNEILYTVSPISDATSYHWTLPQGASGTSETNSILISYGTSALSGNITVKGINACGEGLSSSFAVVVNPLLGIPSVKQIGNALHSDSPTGNQWYNKYGLINGATDQNYTPESNGYYHVVVSVFDCISEPSDSVFFFPTKAEQSFFDQSIKVYPNPVLNEMNIEIEGNTITTDFEVLNTLGQTIFNGFVKEKAVVQTDQYPPGIYVIKIKFGGRYEFKKILKK